MVFFKIESQLRGTNVTVNVRRDTKGGVLYDPISGDVTALRYEDMQVNIKISVYVKPWRVAKHISTTIMPS